MLHDDDIEYFDRLRRIGFEVAAAACIDVAVIEPKRRPATGDGVAYLEQRRISISVRGKNLARDNGAWWPHRHRHNYNLHTLGHELAHLQEHQLHGKSWHGPRFYEYERVLVAAVTVADARC